LSALVHVLISFRKLVPCAVGFAFRNSAASGEVGKGRTRAEVDALLEARPEGEQRHVLAGMVGRRRGRVVAVVRGDEEQVIRVQLVQDGG